jgi:hypothetical protein
MMNLLISIIATASVFGMTSVALFAHDNGRGPAILQKLGKKILAKTWRTWIVAEINIVLFSVLIFFVNVQTMLSEIIANPARVPLSTFTFFSLLFTIGILGRRGHIQVHWQSAESRAKILASKIEEADNPVMAFRMYLQFRGDSRHVPDRTRYKFLTLMSERDDEIGKLARKYLRNRLES